MNLQEIVDATRDKLGNYELPYLWQDREMVNFANEAQNTICRDGRVLEDSTTASVCQFSTVAGTAEYALNSSIIYVRSIKLRTQETLTLNVAPATDWSAGDTLTCGTSTCYVVAKLTSLTYTISKRTGIFAAAGTVTNGTYAAIQTGIYPTVTDTTTTSQFLDKYSKLEMDSYSPSWRTQATAQPTRYMVDYNTGYMTLYPIPDIIYVAEMSVIRYPLTQLSATAMSGQTPEVNAKWHNALIEGMCYQAYQKRGVDTYDEKKSAVHFSNFRKQIANMKMINNLFEGNASTSGPIQGFI